MLLDPLAHFGLRQLQNIRIRETALDVAILAFSVDEREILGMFIE